MLLRQDHRPTTDTSDDTRTDDGRQALPATLAAASATADHIDLLHGFVERANEQQSAILEALDSRAAAVRAELEAARSTLDAGATAASEVDDACESGLGKAQETVANSLAEVTAALEAKAGGATEVMETIGKIGRSIHLLSINASIEAAHAGSLSKGFAVIADEVRELADQTISYVDVARGLIDLSELVTSLDHAKDNCQTTLDAIGERIKATTLQVTETNDAIGQRFDALADSNQVLFELAESSKVVANRFSARNDAARKATQTLAAALAAGGRRRVEAIQALAQDLDLDIVEGRDRLAEIRARGELRVAIEPSFVGLSFRLKTGAPLQGLDVDYAEAFAKWLGVRCRFVEVPWDVITEALYLPGDRQPRADIVISALPPDPSYDAVAYSDTYTHLEFVLCRRAGDRSIESLRDLEGKAVGIINDPGAYEVLEAAGLRWPEIADKPGGTTQIGSLIAYSDQARIHDCLAEGVVDAFCVDLPIYYWASNAPESPWNGKLEILPGHLGADLYYYTMAVTATRSSLPLLRAANAFIAWFKGSRERRQIEERWQGQVVPGDCHYSKEAGGLIGEPELAARFG